MFALVRNLALGLVIATAPALAEPLKLIALGDSLTAGYGLPSEEGFVPQLEAWLRESGAEVDVVNAGVSGDTTAGGLSRIEWTLAGERDADAIMIALGGNDLLRGLSPKASRRYLAGMLDVARAAGLPVLLIGIEAPGNYGPDYKEEFDAIFPSLAEDYGTLYLRSFLEPLSGRENLHATMREMMQPDGIHPNAEGVRVIVEGIGPKVLELLRQAGG